MEYETDYPGAVLLQDDEALYELTIEDNRERVLITETDASVAQLQKAFQNEGFSETSIEYKKPYQVGNGFLKTLSDDWDMHVRFMQLHDGLIAIDGEVETSRKWVEHNTKDNWISVIYEVSNILQKYHLNFYIWHKNAAICRQHCGANENSDDSLRTNSMEACCNCWRSYHCIRLGCVGN